MPKTTTLIIDERTVAVSTEEFSSANILRVTVGTNCPHGGDTGHGGRTVLILEDLGGTDLRCSCDGGPVSSTQRIEIVLGGDTECDTFIDALEYAAQTLR